MKNLFKHKYSKWITISGILIFISLNLVGWVFYFYTSNFFMSGLDKSLLDSGRMIASLVDGNILRELDVGFDDLYPVKRQRELLANFQRGGQFSKVLILKSNAEVLISTDKELKIGDIPGYKLVDLPEIKRASEGEAVVSVIYKVDVNLFKSSYTPIRDQSGKVTGVLCIETRADFLKVLDNLKIILLFIGLFSLIFVLILIVFFINLQSHLLSVQNNLIKNDNFFRLGKLSSSVAHELRNPLQIIRGNLEILLETETDDENKEIFKSIIEEISRMNRTIQSMLNISIKEKDKRQAVDINEIIQELITVFKPKIKNAGMEINFQPGTIPEIIFDKDKFKQVLMNLIQNSFESLKSGGEILLITSSKGKKIILEVIDNGCGIDYKLQEKVFEPFFSTKTTGAGIGLAVVKRILEEGYALIDLESEREKGTKFTITFNLINREVKSDGKS
ncbi:hypothetical protein KAU33_00490 [Candidatus Dependentiae bacterium]|nr:hypothetical protein [Candidatus Dependentiae bacterium]